MIRNIPNYPQVLLPSDVARIMHHKYGREHFDGQEMPKSYEEQIIAGQTDTAGAKFRDRLMDDLKSRIDSGIYGNHKLTGYNPQWVPPFVGRGSNYKDDSINGFGSGILSKSSSFNLETALPYQDRLNLLKKYIGEVSETTRISVATPTRISVSTMEKQKPKEVLSDDDFDKILFDLDAIEQSINERVFSNQLVTKLSNTVYSILTKWRVLTNAQLTDFLTTLVNLKDGLDDPVYRTRLDDEGYSKGNNIIDAIFFATEKAINLFTVIQRDYLNLQSQNKKLIPTSELYDRYYVEFIPRRTRWNPKTGSFTDAATVVSTSTSSSSSSSRLSRLPTSVGSPSLSEDYGRTPPLLPPPTPPVVFQERRPVRGSLQQHRGRTTPIRRRLAIPLTESESESESE